MNEVAHFGQRDEFSGCDGAEVGVFPAGQCFAADALARLHVDLGLVVQLHLSLMDGVAQVGHHAQAARAVSVEAGIVDGVTTTSFLGMVHGHIGAA